MTASPDSSSPSTGQVVIEVPSEDWSELENLQGKTSEVHGIDGATVVELIIPSAGLAARLLRTWILARKDRLSNVSVIWNGREFRGLSGREIERLVERMEKESDDDD